MTLFSWCCSDVILITRLDTDLDHLSCRRCGQETFWVSKPRDRPDRELQFDAKDRRLLQLFRIEAS